MSTAALYSLQLADTALVLAQRNAEWASNGPSLEEDIAMTNQSLDLLGQARFCYQHAASLLGGGQTEDRLAYFRGAHEFRNLCLVELPHFDAREGLLSPTAHFERCYATTLVRNFFFAAWMQLVWRELAKSSDAQLAAIAERASKEVTYHLRVSRDWLLRFGAGTAESHARAQAAVNALWPYVAELWVPSHAERAAHAHGIAPDVAALEAPWLQAVDVALAQATLTRPNAAPHAPTEGKNGLHTTHLSYVLAEMQSVAREHPEGVW